mgnify:CR=1 FL=1
MDSHFGAHDDGEGFDDEWPEFDETDWGVWSHEPSSIVRQEQLANEQINEMHAVVQSQSVLRSLLNARFVRVSRALQTWRLTAREWRRIEDAARLRSEIAELESLLANVRVSHANAAFSCLNAMAKTSCSPGSRSR